MTEVMVGDLAAERLANLVGTTFSVIAGLERHTGEPVSLKLVAVDHPRNAAAGYETIVLLFDGPGNQPLGQGSHRFAHEAIGWFDMFIVPVGAARGARQYEAVINRAKPGPR